MSFPKYVVHYGKASWIVYLAKAVVRLRPALLLPFRTLETTFPTLSYYNNTFWNRTIGYCYRA
jgi:hypothetical protein